MCALQRQKLSNTGHSNVYRSQMHNDMNNIHWGSSPHPFDCWWWSTNDYCSIRTVRATGGWHTCSCLVFFFDAPLHGLVFGYVRE